MIQTVLYEFLKKCKLKPKAQLHYVALYVTICAILVWQRSLTGTADRIPIGKVKV